MTDLAQVVDKTLIDLDFDPLANEPKASAIATRMGRLLMQNGKINAEGLKAIMTLQNERGLRFGDAALALGLVQPADIKAVLAEQFSYTAQPEANTRLSPQLTAVFQPESPEAEALRSLRSELMLRYFNTSSGQLSLALIGADDSEGIARTAANLSIVFAQLGLKTLLVDTNLRKPLMNKWFGLNERQPGLADLVAGRARVQPTAIASLRSLWVLPAGTQAPNPQELLTCRQYSERMKDLVNRFDVTLISTASMDKHRDAQVVAAQAGAALLVIRKHQSRMKELTDTCSNLRELGVRLLGAALRQ